ncbi:hypothetical protein KJ903_05660 [Patescibacteria group bacterium]|nr:hypothetical protein [Patescibacteria group bacterium]
MSKPLLLSPINETGDDSRPLLEKHGFEVEPEKVWGRYEVTLPSGWDTSKTNGRVYLHDDQGRRVLVDHPSSGWLMEVADQFSDL